jgi:hypothetical protein
MNCEYKQIVSILVAISAIACPNLSGFGHHFFLILRDHFQGTIQGCIKTENTVTKTRKGPNSQFDPTGKIIHNNGVIRRYWLI